MTLFLETNEVDASLINEIELELTSPETQILEGDFSGETENSFTDQNSENEVNEDNLDQDMEIVEIAMNDILNYSSSDNNEDFACDGL